MEVSIVAPPGGGGGSSGPEQYQLDGVNTTVSQDTATPANSRPLPVRQLNTSGAPINGATSELQTTGNTSLASIDAKNPALVGGRVPVDGSGVTQPVSGSFLTDTQLRAAAVPVSGPLTDTQLRATAVSTQPNPAIDIAQSGTLAALNDAVTISTSGEATTVAELTAASLVGTIIFEASNNGFTTVTPVAAVYLNGLAMQAAAWTNPAVGSYSVLTAGFKQLRVRVSAFTSGSASVLMNASVGNRISVALQGNPANLQTTATQGPAGASAWLVSSTPTPSSLGTRTTANSPAVNIASDQAAIPAYTPDTNNSGSISAQNANLSTGTATANSAVSVTNLQGMAMGIIQYATAGVGTLVAQMTVDGLTWVTTSVQNVNTGALTASMNLTTPGIYIFECAGAQAIRVTASAYTSGAPNVYIRSCARSGLVGLDSPIPAGTNSIGAVTVTGSLASVTSITNTVNTKAGGKTTLNPSRLDYTTAGVNTSTWVQVIAGTTGAITELHIFDSGGYSLYLATGNAGAEVLIGIIPPGGDMFPIALAASTRLSVKAVATGPTVGELLFNYFN